MIRHPGIEVLVKVLRIPQAGFGVGVISITVLAALLAPWIVPVSPEEMDFDRLLSGVSMEHWLGSDQMGRDTLSRLIYGARVALIVSFGAIGLGVLIGVPLGLVSVYFRGFIDDVIMRIMDALVVFPSLLIAVGLAAALGGSLTTVILAIGIANVPWMARVVRSQGLSIRELDFVAAAEAGGMGQFRIIFKHILPNSLAPVIVQCTLSMGYAVLTEAALGFIGVGIQPPVPTWGNMLQQAFPMLEQQALLSVVPGLAIFLLVLSFNFVGDALRDVLDPRLRGVIH
ncbi:MAG TPA: ABC transporter permease [Arenicellales bacterium]|jgi:peptide/nickel transport system permease protein|nr:glutathione ABC transporter permease GsiD [Gammaproteobacteria bacterium]MDP6024320.1 ABC transporter permease [Pseudomonadales bacterium]MDP7316506.1 ABC transporter permease [Pseudomonadales bacterium]HJL52340.1 ABC transporter permease [Arenicellales bacterium]HJP52122.1 ABC transporter permease [Pseudomonadales bacterium]